MQSACVLNSKSTSPRSNVLLYAVSKVKLTFSMIIRKGFWHFARSLETETVSFRFAWVVCSRISLLSTKRHSLEIQYVSHLPCMEVMQKFKRFLLSCWLECCSVFVTVSSLTVLTYFRLFTRGKEQKRAGEKVRQSSCEFSALKIFVRWKQAPSLWIRNRNHISDSLSTFLFLLPCSYPCQSHSTEESWLNTFIEYFISSFILL